jgi:multidrug resistance efflux pump
MSATFSRTLRSLEADRSRRLFVEALLFVLLGGWTAWMLLGRVSVFEVSERARLEVKSAAHPVAAPVGGQIVETRLTIGRYVEAGEMLVVLDAEAERRAVAERRARRDTLRARAGALVREFEAEEEAFRNQQKARDAAREEAKAQLKQAVAATWRKPNRFAAPSVWVTCSTACRPGCSKSSGRPAGSSARARRAACTWRGPFSRTRTSSF